MLKKSGTNDEEQPSKDKKKNKKEKGYNKIGDKSPDAAVADNSSNRNARPGKPSSLKKPTFRLPSTGKKEKQKSVKINEEPIVDRPRSSTVPSLSTATSNALDLDISMPNISPLPADLVVLLEGRPVFGQPLASAPRCHDTALPVIVRECIDYLEQRLAAASSASQLESLQGLYQRAADKVAVDRLRDSYERGELVSLDSCNPADVAGLLQAYLRSLPAPLLTTNLIQQFEHAADSRPERCVPELKQLLGELPPLNRTVLAWLSVHLRHLCTVTSVKPASLALSLQTTLQMSHRLLVVFIEHVDELFPGVAIRPYVPQWVLCLPDAIAAVEEDLRWREMHLEGLLARLAANSSAELGGEPAPMDKAAVEQSWEQQRIVTQLKRKLKKLKKYTEAGRRPSTVQASTLSSVAESGSAKSATDPNSTPPQLQAANMNTSSLADSHGMNGRTAPTTPSASKEQAQASTPANSQQPTPSATTTSVDEQPSGDNARVLYAELKDLFGLLKMMKIRNPQGANAQSADVSLVNAATKEPEPPSSVAADALKTSTTTVEPAHQPSTVVSSVESAETTTTITAPTTPSAGAVVSDATAVSAGSPTIAENQPQLPPPPPVVTEKPVVPAKSVASPPIRQDTQPEPPVPPQLGAELIEQRRSIQLAYLWLKIEEAEYQTLIAETEKQLENERQLIKQLAGVINEEKDPDTDSFVNDDDSEGHMNVPSAIAGSSMALVAHDELDNDSSSDEETNLNNTHKAIMLMRQNEKLERSIQELERNVLIESEECLQLRVQLRFLELLSSSSNDEASAMTDAVAAAASQIASPTTTATSAALWPPVTEIGAA